MNVFHYLLINYYNSYFPECDFFAFSKVAELGLNLCELNWTVSFSTNNFSADKKIIGGEESLQLLLLLLSSGEKEFVANSLFSLVTS